MNKWISEFKTIVNDDTIVKYYEEEILTLTDKSYENICKMIGEPEKVGNEELKNEQNNAKIDFKLFKNPKNLKVLLFILIPLLIVFLLDFLFVIFNASSLFKLIILIVNDNKHFSSFNPIIPLSREITFLIAKISLLVIIYELFSYVLSNIQNNLYNLKNYRFISFLFIGLISIGAFIVLINIDHGHQPINRHHLDMKFKENLEFSHKHNFIKEKKEF